MKSSRCKHVVAKWNPMWNPQEYFEPRTIEVHCDFLQRFQHAAEPGYVWFGKISKSGVTGIADSEVKEINSIISQGTAVHLYLYCAYSSPRQFHVAKIEEVAQTDQRLDSHTPGYYAKVPYEIPYWFKLSDIRKVDEHVFDNLTETDGKNFDPVSSLHGPRVVYEKVPQVFFDYALTAGRKWFQTRVAGSGMPRCFKTGASGCGNPSVLPESSDRVFVAMPFNPDSENVFAHGIKPALDAARFTAWKADNEFRNIDLMCHVCAGIQACGLGIVDISSWNANVLLELGLLYGLGKQAIIIKHKKAKVPVDLQGMLYIEYDTYSKLCDKLVRHLKQNT